MDVCWPSHPLEKVYAVIAVDRELRRSSSPTLFRWRGGSRAHPFGDGMRIEPNACSKTKRWDVPPPRVLENCDSGNGQQRREFVRRQRVVKALDSVSKGRGQWEPQKGYLFGKLGFTTEMAGRPTGPRVIRQPTSPDFVQRASNIIIPAQNPHWKRILLPQAKISFTLARVCWLRDGFK